MLIGGKCYEKFCKDKNPHNYRNAKKLWLGRKRFYQILIIVWKTDMGEYPCYVTNYIRQNVVVGQTDEELYAEMKLMVECGAKLVDLRGDMFCPTDSEITTDPVAIKRQKQAIKELHDMGAEVLMSTHTLKYITPNEVMNIARQHKSRGVDITKIVIDVNTKDEQRDAFINTFAL